MKISIFGLGYVGAVTMGCLARRGHEVVGVDVNLEKVRAFRNGESPIVEPGLSECIADGRRLGLLDATDDHESAAVETDISIVCVGTPARENGGLDLTYVQKVTDQIADAINTKDTPHTVIFRSTMLPGSTRQMAENRLKSLRESRRLRVCFYPEFLREGSAIRDFEDSPLNAIGTEDGSSLPEDLLPLVGDDVVVLPWESAELLKYACNAFHAAKVVFANEIGRIGKKADIDSTSVMKLFCEDTVLNLSSYYLRPGNPFGGSCLPKDVRALSRFANQAGIETPMIASLVSSNRHHADALRTTIRRLGYGDVTILGLSFKNNTDDLRESPMVDVVRDLIPSGRRVRVYDPSLKPENLTGANMQQINEKLPGFTELLCSTLREAIGPDGLVVVAHPCVGIDELHRHLTERHIVLDVNGWPELRSLPSRYEGFLW
jgi:GDP-mannose 6-dehydrogenase